MQLFRKRSILQPIHQHGRLTQTVEIAAVERQVFISTAELPNGLYLIQVGGQEKKLVVQH